MTIDDLKKLPVSNIANKNSLCFMWLVSPKVDLGIEVLKAWGFTSITKLPYIGWDSVDSTAWLTGARYGSGIYQFIGNKLLKSKKPDNSRYIDYKPIQLKNFNEWIKYQRYAEKYL